VHAHSVRKWPTSLPFIDNRLAETPESDCGYGSIRKGGYVCVRSGATLLSLVGVAILCDGFASGGRLELIVLGLLVLAAAAGVVAREWTGTLRND